MMNFYQKIILLLVFTLVFSCNPNDFKNKKDVSGAVINKIKELQTQKIGTANWTIKNLDVDTFKNGDIISEVKSNEEWISASKAKLPAWCYYENNPNNAKYGKLYNWYAVTDNRGLAPTGYHVPSIQELKGLSEAAYGNYSIAGKKLKSTAGWEQNNGDNESGFNALPSGGRTPDGDYISLGKESYFWSVSDGDDGAEAIILISNDNELRPHTDYKGNGFSVRIIKD